MIHYDFEFLAFSVAFLLFGQEAQPQLSRRELFLVLGARRLLTLLQFLRQIFIRFDPSKLPVHVLYFILDHNRSVETAFIYHAAALLYYNRVRRIPNLKHYNTACRFCTPADESTRKSKVQRPV